MMCCNPEDLRETAEWNGRGVESRTKLIEKLQGRFYCAGKRKNNDYTLLLKFFYALFVEFIETYTLLMESISVQYRVFHIKCGVAKHFVSIFF